jgi:hypothetical protein
MFAIGDPETEKIDSHYESCEAAEVAAVEKSIDDHIWAVWEDEGTENNPALILVSLVFRQQVFTS